MEIIMYALYIISIILCCIGVIVIIFMLYESISYSIYIYKKQISSYKQHKKWQEEKEFKQKQFIQHIKESILENEKHITSNKLEGWFTEKADGYKLE